MSGITPDIATAAVREARASVVGLLSRLPVDVWRVHKNTVENAIAMQVEQNLEQRQRIGDLTAALEDAHDALGELMGSPFVQLDWDQLADWLGNTSWVGLKERIDAALAKAGGEAQE